ncbi:hypothetical protein CQ018_11585 [Arthrobacter sp. MYb227]|uniref:SHOCT domain-containing protein n=1 Tax=Arthrobacter sp. MYb227 TaxID=1848601 RepID=UPI000CFCFC9B|nr:SHOCT domain-containing protein [Arthrobacter sp. MYb227]PQZ92159.1 hypothetical protein CQ018_11585 [Arthrobacter sp. MYb227]
MSLLSSFWDLIWWFITAFVFIAYLMALFSIISDLFRDPKIKGWLKAVWLIFLIFLPFLTAIVYLIVRGKGMGERTIAQQRAVRESTEQYIRKAAGVGVVEEIEKAKNLLDSGAITAEEYAALKKRVLV